MATRQRRGSGRSRKTQEHDRDYCRIDGRKLRKLRLDAELTIRALAYAVDVDPKTITDIEAGRRERSQIRVARSIAAHPEINVDWTELLPDDDKRRPPPTIALAPRSSLDALVAEERRIGKPAPITVGSSLIPVLGASDLVNIFASPGSHSGECACVTGLVHTQRGLPPPTRPCWASITNDALVSRSSASSAASSVRWASPSRRRTRRRHGHLQSAWERHSTTGVVVSVVTVSFRELIRSRRPRIARQPSADRPAAPRGRRRTMARLSAHRGEERTPPEATPVDARGRRKGVGLICDFAFKPEGFRKKFCGKVCWEEAKGSY